MGKELVKIDQPEIISPLVPSKPNDTHRRDLILGRTCLVLCGVTAGALVFGGFAFAQNDDKKASTSNYSTPETKPSTSSATVETPKTTTTPVETVGPQSTLRNGSFVVGNDVVPGLYRSSGIDTSQSTNFCYVVTKLDGIIKENEVSYNAGEPVIVKVEANTIVSVKGCLTFHKIG